MAHYDVSWSASLGGGQPIRRDETAKSFLLLVVGEVTGVFV